MRVRTEPVAGVAGAFAGVHAVDGVVRRGVRAVLASAVAFEEGDLDLGMRNIPAFAHTFSGEEDADPACT